MERLLKNPKDAKVINAEWWWWWWHETAETALYSGYLGGNSPFTLKLGLVPLKCLLTAAGEVCAVVVLWQTMLHRREVRGE
jgi:hypothetical protein